MINFNISLQHYLYECHIPLCLEKLPNVRDTGMRKTREKKRLYRKGRGLEKLSNVCDTHVTITKRPDRKGRSLEKLSNGAFSAAAEETHTCLCYVRPVTALLVNLSVLLLIIKKENPEHYSHQVTTGAKNRLITALKA